MTIQTKLVYPSNRKEPGSAYREWMENKEKQDKTFKRINRGIWIVMIVAILWEISKGLCGIAMDRTPQKELPKARNWRRRHRIHDLKYY